MCEDLTIPGTAVSSALTALLKAHSPLVLEAVP